MTLPLRPLIAIIGTTGTGKTKLAVQVAKRLALSDLCNGAEVINADAMQVYAGMDIITNKATAEEMQGVKHHLMAFRQPGQQYTVGEWVTDAMKIIGDLHSQNKVPIIVGGTSVNYEEPKIEDSSTISPELAQSLSQLPPELLDLYHTLPETVSADDDDTALRMYKLLNALDPRMGARWHWNDTRKVLRSLTIIKSSGRLATDRVLNQSQVTYTPRYRSLLFWLYATNSAMHPRLDARVDDMFSRGLIDEVRALLDIKNSSGDQDLDFTTGIYQSIGYREFFNYLTLPQPDDSALSSAVEAMKTSTRQYAKRQVSWIRNKLLPEANAANRNEKFVSTYLFDVADLDEWPKSVQSPGFRITEDFLKGTLDLDPQSLSEIAREMLTPPQRETDPISRLDAHKKIVCPQCTVDKERPVLIDENLWDEHQKARVHRRRTQSGQKKEQYLCYLRSQSGMQDLE
ncbi:tRNA isopentenyltransferase [Hymenopellis radicata]|nr:tRNA isopentenyltransferase [Hymenopellis radicata]